MIRNIKNVLSMRDKLIDNQPGKAVNGRQLLKPKSIPLKSRTKRNSICQQGGDDVWRQLNNRSPSDRHSSIDIAENHSSLGPI